MAWKIMSLCSGCLLKISSISCCRTKPWNLAAFVACCSSLGSQVSHAPETLGRIWQQTYPKIVPGLFRCYSWLHQVTKTNNTRSEKKALIFRIINNLMQMQRKWAIQVSGKGSCTDGNKTASQRRIQDFNLNRF